MGKVAGILVGVLLVGGAVVALGSVAGETSTSDVPIPGCTDATAQNFTPTATVDNGSCIYDEGKSPEEIEEREEEEQQNLEAYNQCVATKNAWEEDCDGLYNRIGIKKGGGTATIASLVTNASTRGCDVRELQADVAINKTKFVQGEDIVITVGKRRWQDCGGWGFEGCWEPWCSASAEQGESLDFKIGVYSNDGTYILRNYQTWLPSGGSSEIGDWCYKELILRTDNLIISEPVAFTVETKIKRGSEGTMCVDSISDYDKSESVFIIYPNKCGTKVKQDCDTLKEAESYKAEWHKSHHSFMSEWV